MIHKIAEECVYQLQNLRGSDRDIATISFWCGAHAVLTLLRNEAEPLVAKTILQRIGPGQYKECLKIASEGDKL